MNCTYLRQNNNKYYCLKKNVGIDIKICDSCLLRKHSGVKELTQSAIAVAESIIIPRKPVLASKELIKIRQKECDKCKHLKNRRCKICGCFLDVKIKFLATHCPIKKW